MPQAKSRLLELNSKLAQTLTDKGVEATADETTTELINKVANIKSGDDSMLKGVIERSVTEVVIPDSATKIGNHVFQNYALLKSVIIPNSVTSIGKEAFYNCKSLTNITIPDSVTDIGGRAFYNCTSLKDAILGNGFNANGLDLSSSAQYTTETIVSWLEALADRTGQPTYTLTIGATNLAKLTEEQVAIATVKNWTLA